MKPLTRQSRWMSTNFVRPPLPIVQASVQQWDSRGQRLRWRPCQWFYLHRKRTWGVSIDRKLSISFTSDQSESRTHKIQWTDEDVEKQYETDQFGNQYSNVFHPCQQCHVYVREMENSQCFIIENETNPSMELHLHRRVFLPRSSTHPW